MRAGPEAEDDIAVIMVMFCTLRNTRLSVSRSGATT
jgi:hypothetical protein